MHYPTYNESPAEPERTNIDEHETKRSGAPASRLGGCLSIDGGWGAGK